MHLPTCAATSSISHVPSHVRFDVRLNTCLPCTQASGDLQSITGPSISLPADVGNEDMEKLRLKIQEGVDLQLGRSPTLGTRRPVDSPPSIVEFFSGLEGQEIKVGEGRVTCEGIGVGQCERFGGVDKVG